MIKASRERKRIQKVIHALISPTKGSRKSLGSPAKARSGETPKAEPNVRRRMWTTPPPSLGTPPTPAEFTMDDEELVAQTPSTQQTSQHVPGLTPQLRAALPPDPLTQWSEEDVSACIKILGREFARDGTNSAHDVTTFDAYAETFLTKGIDGQRFANISIPQLMHDLGVSNYNHRLKIVSWIKSYLEDKMICPALALPDSPREGEEECETPDAKDRAIANLSMKLHDMQQALSDVANKQAALELSSQRGSPTLANKSLVQQNANEATEKLTVALAEAKDKMLQYSQDATDAHEAMVKAVDENVKLTATLKKYESMIPDLKESNDVLREETLAALEAMQSEFAKAIVRTEAEARTTVVGLEQERDYQEHRNGALHARNRQLYNQIQDLKGAIRVYTRIRPVASSDNGPGAVVFPGRCLDPAAEGMDVVCKPPAGKLSNTGERRPAGRRVEEKRYSFDKVFGPDSTQAAVYEELSPLVCGILDGYNVCIFAYGQTGSGKTYTMGGPGDATGAGGEDSAGVNTRALQELFESVESRAAADGAAFTISVEMREIYNEQVRDLLNPEEKEETWNGVKAHTSSLRPTTAREKSGSGDDDGSTTVTRVVAHDAAHVLQIMAEGTVNRASAGTAMNERSSRSHSVVTVYAEGTHAAGSGRIISGRLHLIDLAGSERVGRSEAKGDRLKEAQHINKSLSALGDVIAALLEKRAHVPYRNSQLTRLLSDSLGGNSKVVLLAHLAPEAASLPESQSTLLFAQRCSQVELGKAKVNTATAPMGGSSEAMLAAIAKYKGELVETRSLLDEETARVNEAVAEKVAAEGLAQEAEEAKAKAEAEVAALRKEIEMLKNSAVAASGGGKSVSGGGGNPYKSRLERPKCHGEDGNKVASSGVSSVAPTRNPLSPRNAGEGRHLVGGSSTASVTTPTSITRPKSAIPTFSSMQRSGPGTPGSKTPSGRPKSAAMTQAAISASSSILRSTSSSSARRLSTGLNSSGISDGGRWH